MKTIQILRLSFVSLLLIMAISVNQSANGKTPDVNDILKSAEQGDPNAQFKVGNMYYHGQGISKNYEQAIKWYWKASEKGDIKWYQNAAENGNVEAQYILGHMYYRGQGVPRDYNEAAKWYQRAAEGGNTLAQVELGGMYEVGQGVPDNHQQAVKWYEKAAEQGYSEAQYRCGLMYFYGNREKGVSKDYQQAIKWFLKASEQGYFSALFQLGEIYEEGKAVPQDYQQAVKWFLKSAEEGDYGESLVRTKIRVMYNEGKCKLQDYEKVIKMIQKKAEQGEESAQFELAEMYLYGDILGPSSKPLLIPQDYQQSISWYLKLAERGGSFARTAQYLLGTIYSEGRGVPQDYVEAYKWFILASLEPQESLGKGYVEARDALRLKMSPQQIAEAQKLAREFKPKSRSNNDAIEDIMKPKQEDKVISE
jgi:TPR repeat protein